jgi:predicted phage-related endonuclease
MRLGTDLEEYVAKRFCEETGKRVINDLFMYMDDEYDFMTANIDRKIIGEKAGLECKTMGSFNGYNLESGEYPTHYAVQCQHYMMVLGWERMYLAILVLQRGLFVFEVERDDEFIKSLREAEIDFWTNYVEKSRIPAPDGSEASLETLRQLYPEEKPNTEIAIPGLDRLIRDYKAMSEMAKDYQKRAEAVKQLICEKLGDNAVGIGDDFGCSWKKQSKVSVSPKRLKEKYPAIFKELAEVSEYRVFRTRNLKKGEK